MGRDHDLDAGAEAVLGKAGAVLDEAERAEPGRPELALLRTALAACTADSFKLRAAYELGREDERAGRMPRRHPSPRGNHLRAIRG